MTEPIEQGTEAWRRLRAGKITASCFKHVLAFSKPTKDRDAEPLEARTTYMHQLAFERLTGEPIHEIHARSLAWGKTNEGRAREEYEIRTGYMVRQVDFIAHPDMPFVGCSPDSLVEEAGGLEIKCPINEGIHLRTWTNGMPEEHAPQVQGSMFVTGRKWWDFLSFDGRLGTSPMALYRQRIQRDEAYIKKLEAALWQFELELRALVKALEKKATEQWRDAA